MPMDLVGRILRPLRGGPRTRRYPDVRPALAPAMRGFPEIDATCCDAGAACARACPTRAIVVLPGAVTIDAGRCIFCGVCAAACPQGAIVMGNRFELAGRTRDGLRVSTKIGGDR